MKQDDTTTTTSNITHSLSSIEDVVSMVQSNALLTGVLQHVSEHHPEAKAFLVGGSVRDAFIKGTLPDDLDIAVSHVDVKALALQLCEALSGTLVPLDPEFGIYRVVMPDKTTTLDISQLLDNDLHTDLHRRDLTINAMAIELKASLAPENPSFHDLENGLNDLESGIVRMIDAANMLDDPLRMLRVYRFAAYFKNATINEATSEVVRLNKDKVLEAAGERIQVEFYKLLDAPNAFESLRKMTDDGLIETIMPEFKPMRDIPPNSHHHLWLLDHTLELVNQAEQWFERLPEEAKAHINRPLNPQVSRMALIKMACLFHDLGKPGTWVIKEMDGKPKHTFYGHEKVSEVMTKAIAKRLKMGGEATRFVEKLVRWHLYPCAFGQQSPRKSILKFLRRIGDEVPDLMLLALADRYSTLGEDITLEILETQTADSFYLIERYFQERELMAEPPLLNGNEVMDRLGIGAGRALGEILKKLVEAQQEGLFTDKEGALTWLDQQGSELK